MGALLEAPLALRPLEAQAAPLRVTYQVELVRATPGGQHPLATGRVSGPQETALRLALRADEVEVEALFTLQPSADTTVTLSATFFTRREVGRSRRGLALLEQDEYRRIAGLAWGQTARVYPLGVPRRSAAESLWIEIAVSAASAGAETRPSEMMTLADSSVEFRVEAVVRPRRVVAVLSLTRGDTSSGPRTLYLVADAPARPVELVAGAGPPRVLEVGLAPPDPPRAARDRALAMDADVVCLRVAEPAAPPPSPTHVLCGRVSNVARKLALSGADTLVVTLGWPGAR